MPDLDQIEKVQGGTISDFWPGSVLSLLTKSTLLESVRPGYRSEAPKIKDESF